MVLDSDDDSDDAEDEATETPSCRTITKSYAHILSTKCWFIL